MKALTLLLAAFLLSACTVVSGMVKDVEKGPDNSLLVTRCDLVVYLALYGLIASEENCHQDVRK